MRRKIVGSLKLEPLTSTPGTAQGAIYFDNTANELRVSNDGSTYTSMATTPGTPYFNGAVTDDFFKFTQDGAGTLTVDTNGTFRLNSGTTAGHSANAHFNSNAFGNTAIFEMTCKADTDSLAVTHPFWGFCDLTYFQGTGDQPQNIGNGCAGFQINSNNNRRAIVSNGTNESNVVLADSFTSFKRFRVIRNGATNVTFFIDGVLKATLTTNLPSLNLDCGISSRHESGGTANPVNFVPWMWRVR